MEESKAFDKAKWHVETIKAAGLPDEQCFVHTGLFVAWCALTGLMNDEAAEQTMLEKLKARTVPPTALYEWNDGCFFSDMLTDEGDRFSRSYFDFELGSYLKDYEATLVAGLRSTFHVPNTWESYDRIAPVIAARLKTFRGEPPKRPWWRLKGDR